MNERFKPHTYEGETPAERPVIKMNLELEAIPGNSSETKHLREMIQDLDEPLLKGIFREYFKKAGSEASSMNFIPLDTIIVSDVIPKDDDNLPRVAEGGRYSEGIIQLGAKEIGDDPSSLLWFIIHEELHAVSDTPIIVEQSGQATTLRGKSGVLRKTETFSRDQMGNWTALGGETLNLKFNEGLTELITEKIFDEYMRRGGETLDEAVLTKYSAYNQNPYRHYLKDAQFYIHLLSALSAVSKDVVEGAVIRTYFRNGDIFPKELQMELAARSPKLPAIVSELLQSDAATGLKHIETLGEVLTSNDLLDQSETEQLLRGIQAIITKNYDTVKEFLETIDTEKKD